MNTLLLIFLAPFLTSTAVGQIESVQAQTPFLETAALKFYCRFGSVLNQDTSHCSPVVEGVQEQPSQTVQEKVVEVVRNVFVPTASAQEVPSSSYLEAMIRRIVLELLPTQQVVQGPKGDKGDKGDAGVGGTQALTLLDTPVTFWSGGGGSVSTGGSTVINNITNIVGTTSTSSLSLQDAYDFGGAGLGKAIDTTAGGAVEITVQDGAGLFNGLTIVGDVNATEGMLFTKYDLGVGGQHAGFGFFDDISNPLAASGMIAGYSFPSNRFSLALRTGGVGAHDLVLANPLTDLAGTTLQNYTGTPNVLALASAGLGSIVQNVGLGNPENVVTADSGSIYFRVDGVGASQQLYVKTGDGTNTGWVALGAGATSSVAWELGGNVGTNSNINFLGTTDNVDLVFKTNNATSGVISADGLSFAFGPGAGAGGASRLDTNFFGFNAGNGATGGASLNFFGRNAGNGATNATEVNFFGDNAGNGAINVVASNFFGTNAGQTATNASDSNFFGTNAGSGATSANNSNFFGPDAGANSINAANSNFFGISAGNNAVDASDANFFGANAGNGASSAVGSNFFGANAGNGATGASFSNFFGAVSGLGATGASNSNFFGTAAGINAVSAANSNFFGANAGDTADTAFNSNFFGTNAGYQATNASDSNFFGTNAGYQATNSISSNFFGNGAGYQSTFANESNFFGLNAGYQAVNANDSRFFGTNAGYQATNANNSSFFGNNAGNRATGASNSNFFGLSAGNAATDANNSNFFGPTAGQSATDAANANFFGNSAGNGATFANDSNFFGLNTGNFATNAFFSNFFGQSAGNGATNASRSNFFGQNAGNGAINAAESIFIGTDAGNGDAVNNTATGTSILIGQNTGTGGFSNSIALGEGAINTAVNQFYIRDAITNFNLAGVNYNFPTVQGATGTALINDGVGNLSWAIVATTSTSSLLTADNGLTVNPVNNVQLGGRLLQNTSIETNDGLGGFFFEVGPNAGEPLFKVDNASNTATLGDASNWTGGTSITADITNRQLRFTTADAGFVPQERMRIDGNGNVGVGTSTPTERLDVVGNLRFSGALMPNNLSGATGTLLMSQGAGLAPIWAATSSLGFCDPTGSGTNNECQGTGALQLLTTGSNNSAFGDNALDALTTGSDNTAFGFNALSAVITVSNNLAIGSNALALNTTGTPNLAIGRNALAANTAGNNNIAVGDAALTSNVFGNQNIAIGRNALTNSVSDDNLAIGYNALTVSVGSGNLALGTNALAANTIGANNIAIGANTATTMTGGFSNIAIGGGALNAALASNANIAIGRFSLAANTAASNLALGVQALQANTTGTPNLAVGLSALFANTTGINNLAIGNNALDSATIANNNLAIGVSAMGNVTAGVAADNNLAIGRSALGAALTATADNNVAIGWGALDANTSAGNNLAIGVDALGANTSGTPNLAIGRNALAANTTGNNSIAIGDNALSLATVGGTNIAIGRNAGALIVGGAGNLIIGDNLNVSGAAVNNEMNIGGFLFGTGINTLTGRLGIGTSSPSEILQVQGNVRFSGALMPNNLSGATGTILLSQGNGLAPIWTATSSLNLSVSSSTIASNFGFIQNGNSFGTTATLGTNDAFDLQFETNNSVRMALTQAGRLTFTNVPGNVFLGGGNDTTTGVGNVGIGMLTLVTNTTGQNNVANGYAALAANTTGYNNTANGGAALTSNTTGYNNTANGILAMQFNISGINNVANGASALRFNTGNSNVASGVQAGYNTTSGSDNVIMGTNSLMGNVTGSRNIAIGSSAMINNTSNNNTALGYQAGYSISSGSENTFLGYNTNTASGTIINATAVGANVMLARSNTLILGNNVNVGMGTTTPSERLQVNGNFRLDGAFMPGNTAGLLGEVLISQGSGLAPVWTATSSLNLSVSSSTIASNFGFIQNGNSFGTTATLGTNDAFDLNLETANTPRITINTLGGVSVAGETGGGGAYTMNVAANTSSNAFRITGSADTIYAQQGAGANVFFIRTAGANTYLTASAGNTLILGVGGTTQNDFNINSLGDTSVRHRLYVADAFSGSATARIGQTIQSATNSGNQTGATTQLLIQPDDGGLDSTGTNIGLNVNMGNLSGGTNYAAVFQNGNVGINSTAPLFMLHVGSSAVVSGTTVARFENAGGTCDVTPNVAGGITCTSDQNLKKDIEAIDPIDSLQKLLTVEVKSYRMNADSSTSTKQTGFLAQQLETQFPGLVLTSVDGRKSVSYAGMTPILTQAIQTLYKFMTDIGVTIENGVAKVGEFAASKVKTEELCVGSVCVTEIQFLQMVQNAQIVPQIESTQVSEVAAPQGNTGSTTPTVVEEVVVPEDQIVDENIVSSVVETVMQPEEIVFEPIMVSDSLQNLDVVAPEI